MIMLSTNNREDNNRKHLEFDKEWFFSSPTDS